MLVHLLTSYYDFDSDLGLKNFVMVCCLLSSSFLYFFHVVFAAASALSKALFSVYFILVLVLQSQSTSSNSLNWLCRYCWCDSKTSFLCCWYQERSRLILASVGENVVSLLLLEYVCLNAILYIPTYYILISLRKMSPESSKKYCLSQNSREPPPGALAPGHLTVGKIVVRGSGAKYR